ncbi:MAG: TRAP transporter small permease [Minwuia sp.]|nr:TRAP transporter small permease [Minwuia sp.]
MDATHDGSNLGRLDHMLGSVETVFNLIAAFSIFFLMLLGVSQIVGRTMGYPMWGYIDFVEQSIAIFAFMGIAYCQRAGGHVRMDLVLRLLKGRSLWIAESLAIVLSMLVVAILIYYGYTHFERAFVQGDSTIDANFPVWPSKLIVPVAFSLLWLRLLLQLIGYIRMVVDPTRVPIGVPTIPTIKDVARQDIDTIGNDDGPDNKTTGQRGAGA